MFRAWFGRASRCTKSWMSEREITFRMCFSRASRCTLHTENAPPAATQTMHNKKADFPRREISFWHHLFRIVACNLLHEIVNVRKGNNVPYVFSSCIKMHATHEIINYALRFNPSFIKMHATHWKYSARRSTTRTMHNKKADFPRGEISFWHNVFSDLMRRLAT